MRPSSPPSSTAAMWSATRKSLTHPAGPGGEHGHAGAVPRHRGRDIQSADMEKEAERCGSRQGDWVKTVDDFYQGFENSLEQAEKNMEGKKIKVEDIPTRLRKMRPPHGHQKWAVRQVCGVLRLPGVPQRPPAGQGYRRPLPAVRRPYAAAQKRQRAASITAAATTPTATL